MSGSIEAAQRLHEAAELPMKVKEVLTLLVNSKKRGTAVSHTTLKGQRDRGHSSGNTNLHAVRDDRHDLTNRVCLGHVCTVQRHELALFVTGPGVAQVP